MKKVIFVVGPTASGKSKLALNSAIKYGGSVVNIDSVQLYKGLEIGSASPTNSEKLLAPHYLYNYVEAPNEMTAGQYVRDFYQLLKDQPNIKFPLFIVGGTGFYIQALEKGMFDIPPIPAEFRLQIENELSSKGPEALMQELKSFEPDSKIHINDHYRLVRAIEVHRYFGKSMEKLQSEVEQRKDALPFPYLKIGVNLEKDQLKQRVEKRTADMIENGLIQEVQDLLSKDFESWAPLQSVGLKETVIMIQMGYSVDWLQAEIVNSTMKLIKKQKTWFQRDSSILWSDHDRSLAEFLQ